MKSQLIAIVAAVLLVGCGPPPKDIREAVKRGDVEAVKQFIANGADMNVKDDIGWTPLHNAAWEGNKEIVELLIAKGAEVNAKDNDGSTPLHVAAYHGHKEIAELLIDTGADVNAQDVLGPNKGATPLDAAIMGKRTETAALIRKHGGKTGEELKAEGK